MSSRMTRTGSVASEPRTASGARPGVLSDDVAEYLRTHGRKGLLRFMTCGSVDDGKSTLIGRLLWESQLLFEDQLAALEADSRRVGTQGDDLDFALLLDGLAAEREQGITIDVAYRYFSTGTRKYVIADAPGHEQYTRNMVTAASTANLAIVLVDARKGVLTQTRRHAYLAHLVGIPHLVVAVNKMDLVGWSQARFEEIRADYLAFAGKLGIADAPGHEQYTRNMVTAASTANLAVILIDARKGVLTQTRRHSYVAHLVGIPHLVVAVNKMDLVGWSQERFLEIRDEFENFLPLLDMKDVQFIPISALNGDNVVDRSAHTPWYEGNTLLGHLENVHIGSDWNLHGFRFPVQWVNRPNNPRDHRLHDFRGLSGQIAGGTVKVGQKVMVLPGGLKSTVKEIWTYDGPLQEAFSPQSVTLVLEHDVDVSRGSMIIGLEHLPGAGTELTAQVCWMHPRALQAGRKFLLKHTTQTVLAAVTSIDERININSYEAEPSPAELAMNDIGTIRLRVAKPLIYDGYGTNRLTGSFILIEQGTNATVAAGMLQPPPEVVKPEYQDFAI